MIQLLAIDLDDTLLSRDLTISQANIDAVLSARKLGVEVMLASGRTLFAMEKYADQLGMLGREGYLISHNGCSIIDTLTKEQIYSRYVPYEDARIVWEAVQRYGLTMQYYGNGCIYSSGLNEYIERDCLLSGQRKEIVEDFDAAILQGKMKYVIPGDPAILPELERELKETLNGRCNMFISKPYFLEILPYNADKGIALEFVAKAYGFKPSQVMAIGDAMNDYGMISYAGLGVAMCNGIEALRRIADVVTHFSNDEDGVAGAISEHILNTPTGVGC